MSIIDISSSERAQLKSITSGLMFTQTSQTQSKSELDTIFNLRYRIPERILTALDDFRESGDSHFMMKGLPLGKEQELILLLTSTLGIPFAHNQEAELVSKVRPKLSAIQSKVPSYFTSVKFDLHTELPYVLNSPDFISLLCKANVPGGYTVTSSISSALSLLDDETIDILKKPLFKIMIPPHFGHDNKFAPPRPLIREFKDGYQVRVRFDELSYPDNVKHAVDALFNAVNKVKVNHLLEPGDLLLINNNASLHGRATFKPTYESVDRELYRVYTMRESSKLLTNYDFQNNRVYGF